MPQNPSIASVPVPRVDEKSPQVKNAETLAAIAGRSTDFKKNFLISEESRNPDEFLSRASLFFRGSC